MPDQVTNYQCPACTGPLHFSPQTGKLVCDYCGSSFDPAQIGNRYAEKEQKARDAFAEAETKPAEDWGADGAGMKTYSCPSCGAQLVCDASSAASSCPYCGNPTVVSGQFGGALRPDWVIPFRLDKNQAVAALKRHYQGKILLPRAFKSENQLQKLQGVYVPFWLFTGRAQADCRFRAEQIFVHQEGDWEVTTTRHYQVSRRGTLDFARVPADGSSRMPDDCMDSLEPFDYGELKPFSAAYLPGFLADRYDVGADESAGRAGKRCENSAAGAMQRDVQGYSTVVTTSADVKLQREKTEYALLPVWTLLTKWRGKDYFFTMNGQTGKFVGDLPVSKAKYWGIFAGVTIGAGLLLSLLGVGNWLASCFL
jgi:uncharacterized Zn finger protein (UPF0148 family)